jgi:hypothetical protein
MNKTREMTLKTTIKKEWENTPIPVMPQKSMYTFCLQQKLMMS